LENDPAAVAKRRTTTLAFRFCGWGTLSENPVEEGHGAQINAEPGV
jgi:hypothetical protein